MGHVAIEAQQSSMAFSEDGFWCGQQSMSSMEEDIPLMAGSADFTAAAMPRPGGRIAIDRATTTVRRVGPRCMTAKKQISCTGGVAGGLRGVCAVVVRLTRRSEPRG